MCLPRIWTLSSNVGGQGSACSQKWLPRAGLKICACSCTGFPCAFGLSCLPHFPSSKKILLLFFSSPASCRYFSVGLWCPAILGLLRGPSSPPLHCCFQRKGLRQTAGATSLVPPSPETADGGNNMLEKSSWTLWHGGVRHPNLRHSPKSLNTLHRIGTRPLAV